MPERDEWLVEELARLGREAAPPVDVRARVMLEVRRMAPPRPDAVSPVAAVWAALAVGLGSLAALGLTGALPSPAGVLGLAVRGGLAAIEVLREAIETAGQALAPLVGAAARALGSAGWLSGVAGALQPLGEAASILALALMALTTITMLARELRRPAA